jgi:hypothetical protein
VSCPLPGPPDLDLLRTFSPSPSLFYLSYSFVEYAPWSPRGWHATAVYNETIWMIGGTPLNSEVWVLSRENIQRLNNREPPLTRAMYCTPLLPPLPCLLSSSFFGSNFSSLLTTSSLLCCILLTLPHCAFSWFHLFPPPPTCPFFCPTLHFPALLWPSGT